jgi:integrative and conjugative element protein (TIGR02256 family)
MKASVIWVNRESLRVLRDEANDKYPDETGGCFIGYYSGINELVVTNVIGPGLKATHSKSYFKPDADWQELEIERLYNESGRRNTYLGDWHTHTLACTGLSWRDKKTLRRISKYKPSRIKSPIMGIMSLHDDWELVVWQLKTIRSFLLFDNSEYDQLELMLF